MFFKYILDSQHMQIEEDLIGQVNWNCAHLTTRKTQNDSRVKRQ